VRVYENPIQSESEIESESESESNTYLPKSEIQANQSENQAKVEVVDISEWWFDQFWNTYPKKVSKPQAKQAFKRKCTSSDIFRKLMDGLKKTIAYQWKNKDPQYIPYPATWLNGERWNDDIQISTGNPYLDLLMKENSGNEQTGNNEDLGNDPLSVWKQ
jgi:hypothetical protein